MIFLGYKSALGGKNSGKPTPTYIGDINKITLQNGIFDNLHVSKGYVYSTEPIDKSWNFNTVLDAAFNGDLHAGNIDFAVSQISSLRVKRRKKGATSWTTLFESPVSKTADLSRDWFSSFECDNTEYEWAIIPILNGIEGNYNTNSGLSSFDGIVVADKETSFLTMISPQVQRTRNKQSSVINTLDGKYPVVIYNSENNYDSGTASGWFMRFDEEKDTWDGEFGWQYRDQLMDFLSDGKPKFLKISGGRAWLVNIIDNPSEDQGEHEYKVTTNFSWVEIGNVDSTEDLYSLGLIDVPDESW